MSAPHEIVLAYTPQERQRLLHETAARLILYGGAAGGGKSTAGRWDVIGWCLQVPGLQAYIFRRTLGELEDNHIRKILEEIPSNLARYNDTKKRLEFHNGSGIEFCYCEKEQDVKRYQGAEIHVLFIDEAAHLTEHQITYLLTRCRLGNFLEQVPENLRGLLPRALLTSNPGGPGHSFLKQTFIDPAEAGTVFIDGAMEWPTIYIPARMQDNSYLDKNYEKQFARLHPALAKALTKGDWDSVVGQAIHTLSRENHMVRSFTPPRHWTRFMAMDWGSAHPFSVGWYTVSEGAILEAKDNWPEVYLPKGAVIRYAEWYGSTGRANEGLRMDSPSVARQLIKLEEERQEGPMDYRVLDSQCWSSTDGPSVWENMVRTSEGRLSFRQCEKDRKANYEEILARLAGTEDDGPMFYCTVDCMHFWRTVPALTLDQNNPEKGWDTKQEDHVADEWGYALRSRPYVMTKEQREAAYWAREDRRGQRRGRSRYG